MVMLRGHGLQDGWLVKLGATGNIEWQKCLGGTNGDWVNSVLQTSDGGYIATGTTQSNDGDVFGGHGDNDAWVVKLDATGNIQWQKCLGGTGSEQAYSTLQTSDGGYILVGTASSNDWDVSGNHGSGDCWVVKLDGAGNMQWQKCLGERTQTSRWPFNKLRMAVTWSRVRSVQVTVMLPATMEWSMAGW
ncbi:MAG: hypothetical protein IPH53_10880 [Flavobacteriales bacterium]|nr:hypothetical protein [Flavobacteriales bacterium]